MARLPLFHRGLPPLLLLQTLLRACRHCSCQGHAATVLTEGMLLLFSTRAAAAVVVAGSMLLSRGARMYSQ